MRKRLDLAIKDVADRSHTVTLASNCKHTDVDLIQKIRENAPETEIV